MNHSVDVRSLAVHEIQTHATQDFLTGTGQSVLVGVLHDRLNRYQLNRSEMSTRPDQLTITLKVEF